MAIDNLNIPDKEDFFARTDVPVEKKLLPAEVNAIRDKINEVVDAFQIESSYTSMTDRNSVPDNQVVLVLDASDDPSVVSGSAFYVYNLSGDTYTRLTFS